MERWRIETELGALLKELARSARASALFDDPARLCALWRAVLLAHSAGELDGGRLEAALAGVHRAEQVALLVAAAELRLSALEAGRLFTAPLPRMEAAQWRLRCERELDGALARGHAFAGELLACGLGEPAAWPRASELARAALSIEASPSARLALARAEYAEGRCAEAEVEYRALLREAEEPGVSAQAGEALALARERAGDLREALARFERAAAEGAGLRAEVSCFALALLLGERRSAHWVAERIEAAAHALPWAKRFAREVRARWELADAARGRVGRRPDPALLADFACSSGTPAAELCAELFPALPQRRS